MALKYIQGGVYFQRKRRQQRILCCRRAFGRMNPPPLIRQLGVADYLGTYEAMRAFTAQRSADTRDELWLVEHAPVFTLGLGADPAHVLRDAVIPPHAIPVIQTDRGGEVTYHGPGQAVIYLLLDLRRRRFRKDDPGAGIFSQRRAA